ncbi:hypothetical protein V6N13_131179 [Hibiscus sabdariffa]
MALLVGQAVLSFDINGNDRETAAADVLAGICGSLSSIAMSSCITSSADPGESYHHDRKCPKVGSLLKGIQHLMLLGMLIKVLVRIYLYTDQGINARFSLARLAKCLGLNLIHPRNRNMGTSMCDDANGGESDMEDASVLESSVVCTHKMGSLEVFDP